MKRALLVCVLVVLCSVYVAAGEYLMNDTGETAYGLHVEFSEPVTITGFGDVLTVVEPTGEAGHRSPCRWPRHVCPRTGPGSASRQ